MNRIFIQARKHLIPLTNGNLYTPFEELLRAKLPMKIEYYGPERICDWTWRFEFQISKRVIGTLDESSK